MRIFSLIFIVTMIGAPLFEAQGAFLQTQRRFVTPLDLISLLHMHFPYSQYSSVDQNCAMITDENRTILGDSSPISGQASAVAPTPAFDQWYRQCLQQYVETDLSSLKNSSGTIDELRTAFARHFGAKASEELWKNAASAPGSELTTMIYIVSNMKWQQLEASLQAEIIRARLRKLLGPDPVILDKGISDDVNGIRERLFAQLLKPGPELTIIDALKRLNMLIGLREEFLVY